MITKNSACFLSICIGILAWGCTPDSARVKEDLNGLCEIAGKISADSSIVPSQRGVQWIREASALKLTHETEKFLVDLSAKQEISYTDFKEFAQKNGVKDFQCQSLKTLIEP